MNSTQQILEVLKFSYLVYDNVREMYFQRWCSLWAQQKAISLRILTTSDVLHNYYCDMWLSYAERRFLEENEDYIKNGIHPIDAQEIFYTYIYELDKFAPLQFLNELKKQQNYVTDKARSK